MEVINSIALYTGWVLIAIVLLSAALALVFFIGDWLLQNILKKLKNYYWVLCYVMYRKSFQEYIKDEQPDRYEEIEKLHNK